RARRARSCGTATAVTSQRPWWTSITRSLVFRPRPLPERQLVRQLRSPPPQGQLLQRLPNRRSSFRRHRVCRESSRKAASRAAFFISRERAAEDSLGVPINNSIPLRRAPWLTEVCLTEARLLAQSNHRGQSESAGGGHF